MNFDIYSSYNTEIQLDDNTIKGETSTSRFRKIPLNELKDKITSIIDGVPEDATGFYLEVHKSYEEQLDAALKSI